MEGESKNDFLFRSGFTLIPCSFATRSAMCSWSSIHYLILSHAHDQLWLKRKIRSGLLSLLEKPYMVKPALSTHPLPCGISACVCFPKVVCIDKCVSNQKWGQRHLEITDWKTKIITVNYIIISGRSKPSDEGEAQSSTAWQKKGGGGGQGSRVSTKKSFGPQFGLKIRRGPRPPRPVSLDLPLINIIIVIIILIINNNDDDLKEAYLLVISISTRGAIL